MKELLWKLIARIASLPRVADWIIARAQRTPYFHIHGKDGTLYMGRWWLFNPYPKDANGDPAPARLKWLPSVRIHHICRPDSDRHLHSHPWDARTIILRGWYLEQLPAHAERGQLGVKGDWRWCSRVRGDTGQLLHTDYHRIHSISSAGVWTLFITWRKRDTWYFDVDGRKVRWREYLGEQG